MGSSWARNPKPLRCLCKPGDEVCGQYLMVRELGALVKPKVTLAPGPSGGRPHGSQAYSRRTPPPRNDDRRGGGAVGCWVGLFRLSLRSCMVQSEPGEVLQTLGQPGHHTPVLPNHGDSNDQPRPDAEGWREEVDGAKISLHTEPPPDGQYYKPDKQRSTTCMPDVCCPRRTT